MKKARELYDSYLCELREKHPQDEPVMRAALDAFDAIQAEGKVTQRLLEPIVQAASDSRKMLFEIPVDFLDQLTGSYGEAREAVATMAVDKRSHTRFNAIMCIGKAAPKSFKLELLRQGLRDKSSKVRLKAADWAGRQRLRELVPDLEDALAAEDNDKARATIEFELRLLRDGYILVTERDGTVRVTAFTPNGCGSRWFEQTEIDQRGIKTIVAELASHLLG
jgi:hypothetical protein